jgi:hypothetical protein
VFKNKRLAMLLAVVLSGWCLFQLAAAACEKDDAAGGTRTIEGPIIWWNSRQMFLGENGKGVTDTSGSEGERVYSSYEAVETQYDMRTSLDTYNDDTRGSWHGRGMLNSPQAWSAKSNVYTNW